MIFLNVDQGTPEWKELRRNSIGSSDIPAIMGKDPYSTAYEKWEQKVLGKEIEPNEAMERGKRLEPVVRDWFSQDFFYCEPKVAQRAESPWMIASLDGLSPDEHPVSGQRVMIEIKCCKKEYYDMVATNSCPDHFYLQMQWQMLVTGLDSAYLIAFDGTTPAVMLIQRHPAVIQQIEAAAHEFYFKHMLTFVPPPKGKKDVQDRYDASWSLCADRWIKAKEVLEEAQEEEKIARENLISLADGRSSRGGGISLTKITRPGSIAYDQIPELQGINLEPYRKAAIEFWKIKEVEN